MPRFERYIGIDYSGAAAPETPLPGIRVYTARHATRITEVRPDRDRRRHWSRADLFTWLLRQLESDDAPALIGIDHGLSFPRSYFNDNGIDANWPAFLDDFAVHWPTDGEGVTVESIRRRERGQAHLRTGAATQRRRTEQATRAKSVFHFDVPGSVAKSTHAGIPWIRRLIHRVESLHAWPFDGWDPPTSVHCIAEVYPALWSGRFPRRGRTADQHDAYAVAASLRALDLDGRLDEVFSPSIDDETRRDAAVEGWILGVTESPMLSAHDA